jgi:hypothetical protein
MERAQSEANARDRPVGKSKYKRMGILKCQFELTNPRPEPKKLRRGACFKFKRFASVVDEAQVINEGRALEIAFQPGFDSKQPFCKFHGQARTIRMLVHQQARPTVTEWDACDIYFILKKFQ